MVQMTKKEKTTYWLGVHLVALGFLLACCAAAGVI